MRKLMLVCVIALAFSTTAMAVDIAIFTQAGWWPQAAADQEMQKIVENVTGASVELFTSADEAALADWVVAHTGNGVPDLLIMCGNFPDSIYPAGNAQPDGSLAELFLDDGNTIINTGDYIFYVGTAGNNDAGGLQNMMDLPDIAMWGDDAIPCVVTPEGERITPSLVNIPSTRPFFLGQLEGDWYPELILAQTEDGSRADPVIVRNAVTGGRVGIFIQVADVLTDIRGDIISEWINNWYLPAAAAPKTSSAPSPVDGAVDVPRDVVLSWKPAPDAVTRDVYFGTSFEDVNAADRDNPLNVLLSQGQTDTTFDPPGILDFGQTYYWRVDEVNGAPDFTIFKGDVWSFTAEPVAYAMTNIIATSNGISDEQAGPQNTVDGSGLNASDQHSTRNADMWLAEPPEDEALYVQYEFDRVYKLYEMLVWNYNEEFELILGFGIKDVTVEYSADGEDWIVLGDVELNQATARATYVANTAVDFQGVSARFVRLTVHSNWGGMDQRGLSEVRFMYIPAQAREPEPADGAVNVDVDSTLAWRAGRDAVSHEVYFGTDSDALDLAATVEAASYDPGALDLDTTYYWQVNAVQEAESWAGDVWSFATQEYLVVDDFESYTDDIDAGEAIFDTWLDGWVNETGSTVGHLQTPFAERTIVRSGRQSMPLFYDNTEAAVSEADLALASDWTTNGIRSLSLYFYGNLDNTGQLYVRINNTKIAYDGPAVNLKRPSWQLWSIDLSAVDNASNISSLTIGVEGAGATGVVYIDDIRLYPEVLDYISPSITGAGDTVKGVPDDGDWPENETPEMAIDGNVNTKFLHFKGGEMATGLQVAPLLGSTIVTGLTFTTANDDFGRDPTSFELYGSNASIDGPYELIAAGEIVDFSQDEVWPRHTRNATPIQFENTTAYRYYQILFPTLRPNNDGLMQIAEIELIGTVVD